MPPVLESLVAGFGNLLPTMIRNRAVGALSKLDDRMLRDIGLTRHDVERLRRYK